MVYMKLAELTEAANVYELELRPPDTDGRYVLVSRSTGERVCCADKDDVAAYLLGYGHGYVSASRDVLAPMLEAEGALEDAADGLSALQEELRGD